MTSKRQSSLTWKRYTWLYRELFVIVLGIFLAFTVNRIYEDYTQRKILEKSLLSLREEYLVNIMEMKNCVRQQNIAIDSLYSYRKDDTHSLMDIASRYPYIPSPEISNTALDQLMSLNLVNQDFELLSSLSAINLSHESLMSHNKRIEDCLYSLETNARNKTGNLAKNLMYNLLSSSRVHSMSVHNTYSNFERYLYKKHLIDSMQIKFMKAFNFEKYATEDIPIIKTPSK